MSRLHECAVVARLTNHRAIAVLTGSHVAEDGLPVVVWERPFGGLHASAFWYMHLPSEAVAHGIAQRSMLVKAIIEPWGEGPTLEDTHAEVEQYNVEVKARYAAADQSFRFVVDGWGRTVGAEERVAIIESFEPCTKFEGPIDLKHAAHKWWVIVADPAVGSALRPVPARYYFGREIAVGTFRSQLTTYNLPQRRYLGPTSMDPELSFLMCAMTCVRRSSLVMDPFVGTGSILIAAAACGALTLGTDIDIRVIKFGKKDAKTGEHVNIWTNFRDYGLQPPLGLLRLDLNRSPLRVGLEEALDAVLADPPYGVRAGGRKSRCAPEMVIPDRSSHIASTAPYSLGECLRDLVDSAARWLVVGGKLAYWVPAAPGYYFEHELPTHPAMEMVANCEQVLGTRYSRRLVVMRKVRRYDAQAAAAHFEALGPPVMALDSLHEHVYATASDDVEGAERRSARGKQSGQPQRLRCKNV